MQSMKRVNAVFKKNLRFSVLDPSPLSLQGILVVLILKGLESVYLCHNGFFQISS
jgi:hypothetical protein